jgi:hypothetical protein
VIARPHLDLARKATNRPTCMRAGCSVLGYRRESGPSRPLQAWQIERKFAEEIKEADAKVTRAPAELLVQDGTRPSRR